MVVAVSLGSRTSWQPRSGFRLGHVMLNHRRRWNFRSAHAKTYADCGRCAEKRYRHNS
jgi:hypothetical protein